MRPSRHKKVLIGLLAILLLLSAGCWNQTDINKSAVVTGMGLDLNNDRQIQFTVQVIAPQSGGGGESGGGEAKKPFLNFSATDKTTSAAARRLSLTVPRNLLWAHTTTYILGEKMAREGLPVINDFLDRNRNIRKSGVLMVAKGSDAQEALKAELPISQNPMFDLVAMLQLQDQQIGNTSQVLLAEYLNALITAGIDPILPVVEVVEEDKKKLLKLSNMAVFNSDKLAGFLNETESRGYRWLRRHPSISGGVITITSPETNNPVLIDVLHYTISEKIITKGSQITIKIKIHEEGNFYEQTDNKNLVTPDLLTSLRARTATKIENEARAYLRRSQELGVDCVGFGMIISQQNPRLWDQIEPHWHEIYPQIKFEFDVHSQLRRTGLTNQTLEVKP